MGKYHTILDALCNPSFRQYFVNAKLIGDKTDIKSLKEYSRNLTRKYIEEQVVYYPNSMSRTETYIVMAKGIFDDIIINNAIHINKLPPVTMSEVRNEKSEGNKKNWEDIKKSQLNAIYSITNIDDNFPSKEEILNIDRDNPMQWDPSKKFTRSSNQSIESFEEQQNILELNTKNIDKYASKNGVDSMTYTKI